jgi:hypothetical protein
MVVNHVRKRAMGLHDMVWERSDDLTGIDSNQAARLSTEVHRRVRALSPVEDERSPATAKSKQFAAVFRRHNGC